MEQKVAVPNFRLLYPRLLNFGIGYGDLERVSKDAQDWPSFTLAIAELGKYWERVAQDATHSEDISTFQEHLRKAVDYYHYAQLRAEDSALKEELRCASRKCYKQLAPLVDPPAIRCEIPFEDISLPGYLRIKRSGAPCVILVGGLDSSKEVELHYFAEIFLRRGCSVFYFDGPGQGELYGQSSMKSGIEKAISSIIEFLSADERIGSAPVGCFGVSFGGYLACRAAALNPRLGACISIGGFFDYRILDRLPPIAAVAVRKFFGFSAQEDPEKLTRYITLEPLQGQMKAPLLIVHGTADHLVDMVQIKAMQNWAAGPVDTIVLEGSEHVCCDRFNVCLPRMGDWMASRLFQECSQQVAAN